MLRFGGNKLQHSVGETIPENFGCQTRLNASIWRQQTSAFHWGDQFCKTLDVKHDEMFRFGHNKHQDSIEETNFANLWMSNATECFDLDATDHWGKPFQNFAKVWMSNTTECFDLEATNFSIPLGKPILQNSGCQTRLNASIRTQQTSTFHWGNQCCKTLDITHD